VDRRQARLIAALSAYRLEEQIGFLLRMAHRHASLVFQNHVAVTELTPPQFAGLVKIHEHRDITRNRPGRMGDIDPATIQGVTRRLVERGLVTRAVDENHKRKLKLRLTELGREVLNASVPAALTVSEQTLKNLQRNERRQLLALLHKLIAP